MPNTAFEIPVTVLIGLGFPRKIRSVLDAIRFLDDQPSFLRDEAFFATDKACRDVLDGNGSVLEVRDVFCAFARRRGMLIEDAWVGPGLPPSVDGLNA